MDELTAVVTGGTRGIGRAVAAAFASEGATVVVGGREGEAIEETVDALEGRGGAATGVRTDVRDEFDVERLVETGSRFGSAGGIDVLVPAASVAHGHPGETPLHRDSYAAFDDQWRTNARGVFATIREAVPHLTDEGRVLVPTSSVARDGEPGYGAYAVSRAGAEAVARGFAADTDYVVGCVDAGGAGALADADGQAPEDVAPMFVWAATDADPDAVDGEILDIGEWKRAAQ